MNRAMGTDELLLRVASRPLSGAAAWGLAIAAPLLLSAGRMAMEPVLSGQSGFILYFPGIFLIALLAGSGPGLLATVLSGLLGYGLFLLQDEPPAFDRNAVSLLMFWSVAALLLFSVLGMRAALRRLAARDHQLQRAAEREQLLAREMGHRVKNLLTVVRSVVLQSARGAADLTDFVSRVEPRLEALAAAQHLALSPMEAVRLREVVDTALTPFAGRRVDTDAVTDCELESATAQGLLLALHELATNAVKYGALSMPKGSVGICSGSCEGGTVEVVWTEAGGPSVTSPARLGFGSRLMRRALQGPGERVEIEYRPSGLRCSFRCRARPLPDPAPLTSRNTPAATAEESPAATRGANAPIPSEGLHDTR